ncbi:MAG: ABC transporter permease [Myxococcota bacterium]
MSNKRGSALLCFGIICSFIFVWQLATMSKPFDVGARSESELEIMVFNGDIVEDAEGKYIFNPNKQKGLPSPGVVFSKITTELGSAFEKKGTNDHGIAHLVFYTVTRFAIGFLVASVVAVVLGVAVGLSPLLLGALNPIIQLLKPISPLAWMPLLLYTVQDPQMTAILVVFMAALWPTVANTAFGVSSIKPDYLRVSSLLELSWARRLFTVILPAAAPAIIAGLRISFGSALVAVVPAEMLLGELGVGYLTWIEWNNLDIAGVLFAILVVGVVGMILDTGFGVLAKTASYPES